MKLYEMIGLKYNVKIVRSKFHMCDENKFHVIFNPFDLQEITIAYLIHVVDKQAIRHKNVSRSEKIQLFCCLVRI